MRFGMCNFDITIRPHTGLKACAVETLSSRYAFQAINVPSFRMAQGFNEGHIPHPQLK